MSNAFDKYKVEIPQRDIENFEYEDSVKILTYHVGTIIPRVLKELDEYIDKRKDFTAKQTSLIIKGNKAKRPAYKMKNYIEEHVDFYQEIEMDILRSVEDILEEVITDMISYNKNKTRKAKFFNTLDSITGQTFVFVIALINLGEHMIKEHGKVKNGRYFEHVLKAKQELSSDIKKLFKSMNRGEVSKEEANAVFRESIDKKVQELIQFDSEIYQEIKYEEDLYTMCTKDSIKGLIYGMVERIRADVTKTPRLIELLEITE